MISATCWYVPGNVQGVSTDLLIDSGSTYTIVDKGLFENIPENSRPPLEKINLVLRSANGETLEVCGQTTMKIEIRLNTFDYLSSHNASGKGSLTRK